MYIPSGNYHFVGGRLVYRRTSVHLHLGHRVLGGIGVCAWDIWGVIVWLLLCLFAPGVGSVHVRC